MSRCRNCGRYIGVQLQANCSKSCCQVSTMFKEVGKYGGEYSFKTIRGKVQNIHRTAPWEVLSSEKYMERLKAEARL